MIRKHVDRLMDRFYAFLRPEPYERIRRLQGQYENETLLLQKTRERLQFTLDSAKLIVNNPFGERTDSYDSVDATPWNHPFLTDENISRFREYSEAVWQFVLETDDRRKKKLNIAFSVNMNQNMHKWAMLARKYGADVTLFLNPMDKSPIMSPEWELFDGECEGAEREMDFSEYKKNIVLNVPCRSVEMDGRKLFTSFQRLLTGDRLEFIKTVSRAVSVRPETLLCYKGFIPYYEWACELSRYDVIYGMDPIGAAYASGKPYCVFPYGGDLMYVCGRSDDLGLVAHLGYTSARFLMASNPHTLGQCRRLGLTNALYLPYPMDDHRYCPGTGLARTEWVRDRGECIYILMTSRLDVKWKGQNDEFFSTLIKTARQRKDIRYVIINWGDSADAILDMINKSRQGKRFLVLQPVGKRKLIDYYRSCDLVLDHFVMGYYGSTALEAASVGKPIIMKLREDHYKPLYKGDIMPAVNVDSSELLSGSILSLIDNEDMRRRKGTEMREWLVRNHGEEKTVPLMLALFRFVASGEELPGEIAKMNPLLDDESEEEKAYHKSCFISVER